jgi:hypothetical protein
MLVFEPKVKNIAHQMDLSSWACRCAAFTCRCIFEPFNETQFPHTAIVGVGNAEVQIGG